MASRSAAELLMSGNAPHEWERPSLAQGALCAPWTPNGALVYAKDSVEFFSEEFADDEIASSQWEERLGELGEWHFCCGSDVFALELRELARKCSAELLLTADEASVDAEGRSAAQALNCSCTQYCSCTRKTTDRSCLGCGIPFADSGRHCNTIAQVPPRRAQTAFTLRSQDAAPRAPPRLVLLWRQV